MIILCAKKASHCCKNMLKIRLHVFTMLYALTNFPFINVLQITGSPYNAKSRMMTTSFEMFGMEQFKAHAL